MGFYLDSIIKFVCVGGFYLFETNLKIGISLFAFKRTQNMRDNLDSREENDFGFIIFLNTLSKVVELSVGKPKLVEKKFLGQLCCERTVQTLVNAIHKKVPANSLHLTLVA